MAAEYLKAASGAKTVGLLIYLGTAIWMLGNPAPGADDADGTTPQIERVATSPLV